METMSPLFLVANIALFIGSLLFWITQRFYKAATVFALVQAGTVCLLLEYFQTGIQDLLPIMGGFYALSILFIMIHTRIRLNSVLKSGNHSENRQILHPEKG